MKVGILGGTFDPIHLGHLLAAEAAREGAGLQEVWFMPANVPPHKPNAPGASAAERLEMVRLAIDGHPFFRACDLELKLGGTSYTIDTVLELGRLRPDAEFSYVIGADMVMYLPKWVRIGELAERIRFIGLQRPGTELDFEALPGNIRERVSIVPMPALDISSTDIRERRKGGRSIRYLVPDAVRDFVERKGLYL